MCKSDYATAGTVVQGYRFAPTGNPGDVTFADDAGDTLKVTAYGDNNAYITAPSDFLVTVNNWPSILDAINRAMTYKSN